MPADRLIAESSLGYYINDCSGSSDVSDHFARVYFTAHYFLVENEARGSAGTHASEPAALVRISGAERLHAQLL